MIADLPIVLAASLRRRALLFVVAAVMVASSGLCVAIGPPLIQISGGVGVVLFGAALVYSGYRLVSPRPSLVIREDGFVDNASALAAGFVPWSNVERIGVTNLGTTSMVAVKLRRPDEVTGQVAWWKRHVMRANHSFGADLYLPATTLPISADRAAALLDQARPPGRPQGPPPGPPS